MNNKYGSFPEAQIQAYKKYLHSKIHWMLIYRDPAFGTQYEYVNVPKYIQSIQSQLDGLNELLSDVPEIIVLMSLIEEAKKECESLSFDYSVYRRLLLDAHSVIDELPEVDGD